MIFPHTFFPPEPQSLWCFSIKFNAAPCECLWFGLFFPRVIVFVFSSQKSCYCLSWNCTFFSSMAGMFPGWGHFVTLIMHLFSHISQGLRHVCWQIHAPNIYFWFGLVFALNATCLQPFWFSTPNLLSRTIAEADLPWGLVRALRAFCYLPQQRIWDYPSSSTPCLSCSQVFETSLFPSSNSVHQGLCLTGSG